MKRRLLTILVFLLLGAIVNVAVAWGIGFMRCSGARLSDPWAIQEMTSKPHAIELTEDETAWFDDWCLQHSIDPSARDGVNAYDIHHFGTHILVYYGLKTELTGLGKRLRQLELEGKPRGFSTGITKIIHHSPGVYRVSLGWPMRSCEKRLWTGAAAKGSWTDGRFSSSGLLIPQMGRLFPATAGYTMPTTPLWPGFAINTLFYAAMLWLFFAAPFALRRRRRIKRGLCPTCAYPVSVSEVCTECGKPVRPRPRNVEPASS